MQSINQATSFIEYEQIAIKMIRHYCKNKGLSIKHFINDNDYIGSAIEGLIKADIKYDDRHNCKLSSFRYRGVVLALLSMKRRKKNIITVPLEEYTVNKQIFINERRNYIAKCNRDLAETLLEKTPFEGHQKTFVQEHFLDGKTFKEIANKYLCSKQNVKQTVSRGIYKMKCVAYKEGLSCEF